MSFLKMKLVESDCGYLTCNKCNSKIGNGCKYVIIKSGGSMGFDKQFEYRYCLSCYKSPLNATVQNIIRFNRSIKKIKKLKKLSKFEFINHVFTE